MKAPFIGSWLLIGWLVTESPGLGATVPASAPPARNVDLLKIYPTALTTGDTAAERARPWEFTGTDIFHLTQFNCEVATNLRITTGPADVGIGHSRDGAVWAVVIPRTGGELRSSISSEPEAIDHVWLRFHPMEITRLLPPATVFEDGATNLVWPMRAIANVKMRSSWQAGGNAMIPEPKDLTVDVGVKDGLRRFFMVDSAAGTAEYVAAFEQQNFIPAAVVQNTNVMAAAFDQLWEAFDHKYAMFVLRPEVDWAKLRAQYRPLALQSRSPYELAGVFAELLKPLRDLHVWLTVAGSPVPVFNRPRLANANRPADRAILHRVARTEGEADGVAWVVTTNDIGFIAIQGWGRSSPDVATQCEAALEKMRGTRGLIVDVRLNGGGSEDLALKFAGRFLENEFTYAYSQFRNGPAHTNLTEKIERTVPPRGPWRYHRPVVLLIGQKCMSSNESFIGMMTGDPAVTTMGDHTCGSSGNPEMINLPMDITVSVPQWIDCLPDGTPLDERGFTPQIQFTPTPGAFEGDRDDLLTAALARLSQAPLPDQPIAGPAFEP